MSANPFLSGPSTAAALQAGLRHQQSGRLEAAREIYRRVLDREPQNDQALELLGLLAHQEGRGRDAIKLLREAVRLSPLTADWHNNLGIVLAERALDDGERGEAVGLFRRAIELKPDFAEAHCNLGIALLRQGKHGAAEESLLAALKWRPAYYDAAFQLGLVSEKLGDAVAAVEAYRLAARIRPESKAAHGNALLAMNYSEKYGVEEIFAAHREWGAGVAVGQTFLSASARSAEEFRTSPEGRQECLPHRLRIAYISADFRDHPRTRFLGPVVANHDRTQVEVFCYSDVRRPDTCTARFQVEADQWRDILGLSDERVVEMIRADKIDVLIDMTGHMGRTGWGFLHAARLRMQMLYPGYPGTSGLPGMDYCLTDEHRDPPGSEAYYTEKLIRIPGGSQCYDPTDAGEDPPSIGPLPMERNGYVTFGCFNRLVKITPATVQLWAGAMQAAAGSVLMLLAEDAESECAGRNVRVTLRDAFAAQGVDPGRIRFESRRPRRAYLQLHNQIDIALDTFPYHGHTTTLDAMWMGVATVALNGQTRAAREAPAMLAAVGLGDLAATSSEDFTQIASRLASDPERLRHLRQHLREMMRHSPLMDARRVAAGIEHACRASLGAPISGSVSTRHAAV